MVNFRFYIVSLIAVFLAVGIGVLVGSTVVDQATVKTLERNQRILREQRQAARDASSSRQAELDRWAAFAEQSRGELLADRLRDVPVLVVAADGVDGKVLDDVHEWLRTSAAKDQGTLRLGGKLALAGQDDVDALSTAMGVDLPSRPDAARDQALAALADVLTPDGDTETSTTTTTAPAGSTT